MFDIMFFRQLCSMEIFKKINLLQIITTEMYVTVRENTKLKALKH